jgi:hypothetical protein
MIEPWGRWTKAAGLLLVSAWLPVSQAAEDYRFFPQPVLIPERGEVTGYVLVLGTNRFSFLPPPKWQVTYEAAEHRAVLRPQDLQASMTFKITLTNSPGAKPPDKEALRQRALEASPEGRIIREMPCHTYGLSGFSFDLERVAGNRTRLLTRQAYVPCPGGLLEFTLTTPAEKFAKFRPIFSNLMTSFEMDLPGPRGSDEPVPPPPPPSRPAAVGGR